MNELLYGAAYYEEYMPYERLEKDVELLKKAGMNVVRIAESTWSTMEPENGVFDFSHIDRVLDAMYRGGIHVIIGTPTYAIPAWMARKYPDILAETSVRKEIYGRRQNMDITNEHYLFYAERAIRSLLSHVKDHPAVIGYQLDNETKYYDAAGSRIQARFKEWLKEKFHNDPEEMNREFGFNYWSNAIHDWDDLPDPRGTINGSYAAEFDRFRRTLVTEFLSWQASIVREYKKEDQFITHNLDFDWRGSSYGIQPNNDHPKIAECLDIAGCDIYHPSAEHLTGLEIAFCGSLIRSLKRKNYLVLETEAQGFANWTPLDGQLRLLAFSHLASGADMVEYWHWHSIHNACETYWKGVLSHDFSENHVYREACTVGADFRRLSEHLIHLKKKNRIAILVNNESRTAEKLFENQGGYVVYNDILTEIYQALYEMNYECDVVFAGNGEISAYDAVILPSMYCASEKLLNELEAYAENGGLLIGSVKTGFANENVKIYSDTQPHILHKAFGMQYNQFAIAENLKLKGAEGAVNGLFECLEPETARTVLSYDHYNWGQYAAVTENKAGKGSAWYIGSLLPMKVLKQVFAEAFSKAGILPNEGSEGFPVIIRKGENGFGKEIVYIFNYSSEKQEAHCPRGNFIELISGKKYAGGEEICLDRWGFVILEEE